MGLSFPTPEDLLHPGIETSPLASPALAGELFITGPRGKPLTLYVVAVKTQLFATPRTSTPGLPVPHHLLKFAQVHIHCISDASQPSHPLKLVIFPSIRDFSNESAVHIRWPMYWNFSFSIISSNEYSGLISLKIDWFDLLGVQGTLRSLLQHHGLKASIFGAQLSLWLSCHNHTWPLGRPYPWLYRPLLADLLFNRLSRFVIAFLLKSNLLLFSWVQSPSAMILELKKRKSVTTSTFSLYLSWSNGAKCPIFFFFFNFKSALSLSSFTLFKRLFGLLSAIRVILSTCLRLLVFLPPILIPAL